MIQGVTLSLINYTFKLSRGSSKVPNLIKQQSNLSNTVLQLLSWTVLRHTMDLICWVGPAILSFIRNAMTIMVESRVISSRPYNERCL